MSILRTKSISTALAIGVTAFALPPVSAQYTGPSEKVMAVTVADVMEKSKDDDKVALKGMLIRKTSDEHYVFSDATGEISVEIDDKVFPKVPVDDKTTVQIRGEVDKGLVGKTEIDVEAMEILK